MEVAVVVLVLFGTGTSQIKADDDATCDDKRELKNWMPTSVVAFVGRDSFSW